MPPEQQTPQPQPEAAAHRSETAPRWTDRLHGLGPVIGLVLLCIGGTLLNGDFATVDNAMNVLTRTAFIGIIAVGMCFVIISGGIDLSVGSMAALIVAEGSARHLAIATPLPLSKEAQRMLRSRRRA
mgnify:CR=1 FL=1